MSRKRMLSPDIWTDEGFLELEPMARLLFIGLISHADDAGRGTASARSLRARIFPGDGLDDDAIAGLKRQVEEHTRCEFYEVEDTEYYQLARWTNHQKVNRPSPSAIPAKDGTHGAFNERSVNAHLEVKEVEEVKEVGEVRGAERHAYAPNVSMTEAEHDALVAKHGADVVTLAIELLDAYKLEKGKHYKSDAGALRSWGIQAALERRDKLRKSGAAPPGVAKFAGRKCAKCGALNTHSGSMCTQCNEDLPRRGA